MPVLPAQPPAIQEPAQAIAPITAEEALMEAYDYGRPLPKAPRLQGMAALSNQWLRTALTFDPKGPLPKNPFPGGPRHQEVQTLLALMKQPGEIPAKAFKALPMQAAGTAVVLWRWGQKQVQQGHFSQVQRRAWEDQLIRTGPDLTRGYALRHAFCWALAEQDEGRFTDIRTMADPSSEDIVNDFQRLFGMLGGPLPSLRLWSLPSLDYRDLTFSSATRIWIYPLEEGSLPVVPDGTLWIIPSITGDQDERSATLDGNIQKEGKALADRLQSEGRQAWFAPSREAMGRLGLVWFPALLELDAKGNLTQIRMGDAGPRRP
jgi:hypothetical protein